MPPTTAKDVPVSSKSHMMRAFPLLLRSLLLLFGLTLLTARGGGQIVESASAARPGNHAFIDVSVIPMRGEGVLEHQTVVVRDGRIAAIGPNGAVEVGPDLAVIQGGGRYLMPGLADMHVHIWDERELPLYIANGVTMVRNMWGERSTLEMRRRIMAGELTGPTIVTGGRIIDGEPRIWANSARAVTPAEGAALVAEQQAAGYDFIKVYSNLRPEVFDAIGAESRRRGISFAGHVPELVPIDHAMRSGMTSIEHLTGFLRATVADGVDVGANSRSPEMLALARRLAAGQLSYGQVFDDRKLEAVAALARETGVWNTPTLHLAENGVLTRAEVQAAMARPEMRYVSPAMQMGWYAPRRSDADQRAMRIFSVDAARRRVAALNRAGAGILAGTDAPNPHVVHGFALHDELAALNRAGLSRYEALRTATVNPAIFLGTPDAFGSIVVGARADLLLLEANPLDDLANLKRRVGVMLRGLWLPEAELQRRLREVADHYRTAPDWFAGTDPLPIADDATVQSRLQLVSSFAGKPLAAERLAVLAGSNGGRSIHAQSVTTGRNAGIRSYQLDIDARGALIRYAFGDRSQFGQGGSVERDGATYRLEIVRRDGIQAITIGSDETMLTGTAADSFLLAPRLRSLAAGETRTLTVWTVATPRGGPRLERQSWTVVREAEPASAGRAGFRIRMRSEEGPLGAMTLWLDLASGAPLRVERSDGLFRQDRIDRTRG